jgi:hypothetical protein
MNPARQTPEPAPGQPDQAHEARNEADVTPAGEVPGQRKDADPDCPGESPMGSPPCAPDGRSADRYAG